MRLAALLACAAMGAMCGNAAAQEAIAKEYGYKFAGETPEAAYFLSGIRRGAEPESVRAWVWTVNHTASSAANEHDAKAEFVVLRCSGRSIEILKTELYREGELLGSNDEPPMIPKDIRAETPMDMAWQVACDMGHRYSVQTLPDIAAVYKMAR